MGRYNFSKLLGKTIVVTVGCSGLQKGIVYKGELVGIYKDAIEIRDIVDVPFYKGQPLSRENKPETKEDENKIEYQKFVQRHVIQRPYILSITKEESL